VLHSSFIWFLVGSALGIAFHEAGHALCAKAMNITVRQVSVGIGPLLWCTRIGATRVELRPLPLAGLVTYDPPYPPRVGTTMLVAAGGILGNLALIGLVGILAGVGLVPSVARPALTTIVATQFK